MFGINLKSKQSVIQSFTGVVGFEPTNTGVKVLELEPLADTPSLIVAPLFYGEKCRTWCKTVIYL